MLPINEMRFGEKKKNHVITIVGELTFREIMHIAEEEKAACKFDLIAHQKERIKYKLWVHTYGELIGQFHKIAYFAKKNAPPWDVEEISQLVKTTMEQLTFKP